MADAKPLETLKPFREALASPGAAALEWKASGKKVVGFRCLYVPEEIIWAAGMLPYPMYGTPEPVRLADAYFQSCTCEMVRNLFDQALEGRLEFLDFLALANTCDAVRRLWDIWNGYIEGAPAAVINNPQKLGSETNREYYLEELRRFRKRMEEVSGTRITDEKLDEAIDLYNRSRALLWELYSLRKHDPPLITGGEAFETAMAAALMPRDRAEPLLRRLLEEVKGREPPDLFGPRILVTGSIIDNAALIDMIEEEGGVVVADDLCTTSKNFRYSVKPDGDPLVALYRFMNERPLCACIHPMEARLDYLSEMVEEFNVEAVIDFNLKYCHSFMYEAPLLRNEMEARDIPVTVLEVGHDMSGHGQLRTRVQAFIEMVET